MSDSSMRSQFEPSSVNAHDSRVEAPDPPQGAPPGRPVVGNLRPPMDGQTGCSFVVFVVLTILACVLALTLLGPHLRENLGDRAATSNYLYMMSSIVGAAGTLLLAGVIALAPMLSLSLHQSYDSLFSLVQQLQSAQSPTRNELEIETQCIETLEGFRKDYGLLNSFYFAVWVLAASCLLIEGVYLVLRPWLAVRAMHDAMNFFAASCVLCALFAVISLVFFARIRPGIHKLDYYTRYFKLRNTMAVPAPPKTPIRTKVVIAVLSVVLIAAVVVTYLLWPVEKRNLKAGINSLAVASAPVFVAADRQSGTLRSREFDYAERSFPAGRLALDALLNGDVDVATVAETPLVVASVARPDLRIVATITRSKLRVVARRSSGIAGVVDLKGKKVGRFEGSSSDYFLWRLLGTAHLELSDVIPTHLQPTDMAGVLRRKDVDAISIWEPHAQRSMDAVADDDVVFDSDGVYQEYFCIATTTKVLGSDAKREATLGFVSSLADAALWMGDNPQPAQGIVGGRVGFASSEIEVVWLRFAFAVEGVTEGLMDTMIGVEHWDADRKNRPTRPPSDLRSLIDDSLVSQLHRP